MRIAVVSDIHGNRTAFEAVLKDLRRTAPDVVFHGGDLADGGSSPVEIVDRIRELSWKGVAGNTDEMLFMPEKLDAFAQQSPALKPMFDCIREMASAAREALGEERLSWLRQLPAVQMHDSVALVHAIPQNAWRAPAPDAPDTEFESAYRPLNWPVVVYGHIHRSFVRTVEGMIVANSGSVGLPYDGDRRAAYLLLDEAGPQVRRVEYDVSKEVKALSESGLPHADWVAKMIQSGSFFMP